MDDYVTCDDCGHPLEVHDLNTCHGSGDECPCRVRVTRREIGDARRRNGLPAAFNRRRF